VAVTWKAKKMGTTWKMLKNKFKTDTIKS